MPRPARLPGRQRSSFGMICGTTECLPSCDPLRRREPGRNGVSEPLGVDVEHIAHTVQAEPDSLPGPFWEFLAGEVIDEDHDVLLNHGLSLGDGMGPPM